MHLRRARAHIVFRVRHGLRAGAKVFGGLVAAGGTALGIVTATGVTVDGLLIGIGMSAAALASLGTAIAKGRPGHLPDVIAISDDPDVSYELLYEPKHVCRYFNERTAVYFGRDFVENAMVESWRRKNPSAFVYLRNTQQEPCAALCILALRSSFMEQFARGRVAEADLEDDDILDPKASRRAGSLYLATLIVEQPHSQIGHRRACVMVWAFLHYYKRVYGLRRTRLIYAVPINSASTNLLRRLGFAVATPAGQRKDAHDLYVFQMTAASWRATLQRVGDYAHVCAIDLTPEGKLPSQPNRGASDVRDG